MCICVRARAPCVRACVRWCLSMCGVHCVVCVRMCVHLFSLKKLPVLVLFGGINLPVKSQRGWARACARELRHDIS